VRVIAEIGELMEPITGRLNATDQRRLTALLAKMLGR
jgi:hypothetical protein